jgi:hypothetical protein
VFACFTTGSLNEPDEAGIIDAWFEHMGAVRDRLAPAADPSVIHWSHAEVSWLEEAYYAVVKRHPEKDWPHPNWFDFLMRVVREEPVVVRGAHGFGLKPVTKAMHARGSSRRFGEMGRPTDSVQWSVRGGVARKRSDEACL